MTGYAVMAADHDRAETFGTLYDAVGYLDAMKDPNLQVFRLEELSESALWDWSTRAADDTNAPNFTYTNERTARNCLRDGHVLIKRRCVRSEWVPA